MAYYFYCPKCGRQEEVERRPRGTVPNCRDGYGVPIYHFECPDCGNLDAGFMLERDKTIDEKVYYRSVIRMYQNIRGFKNEI
jgi:predicted RNA-binding Zn-ribbon protein involved in translation (DUF1610 family)